MVTTVASKSTGTTNARRELATADYSSSAVWAGVSVRSSGTKRASLRDNFRERKSDWLGATGHWSAPSRIYSHPTYHRLVALGRGIIPLLLEDIRDGASCDWYRLLRFHADFEAVTDAERGDVDLMDAAWLRWGRDNGYID